MNIFQSGFVSLIGHPNVGKSTLMNRLMGNKLSAVTPKAQTTRHRIMGILNGANYQIVYSDTPGVLEPKYALHQAMMNYVKVSLEDADLILLVAEWNEAPGPEVIRRLGKVQTPVLLLMNKIDQAGNKQDTSSLWKEAVPAIKKVIRVSAKTGENTEHLLDEVLTLLPEHPAYFPTDNDEFSDRTERFFSSEIIREKIFLNYSEEVPYSTAVVITSFKEEDDIIRIAAEIYVERDSQKGILIGKKGAALKKTGTEARLELESFFGKKVFLETHIRVAGNWRTMMDKIKQLGYTE